LSHRDLDSALRHARTEVSRSPGHLQTPHSVGRESVTPPDWTPEPKMMPNGFVCNHEGQMANYCTRCWAYLKPHDR
jgi:hypothetical protein